MFIWAPGKILQVLLMKRYLTMDASQIEQLSSDPVANDKTLQVGEALEPIDCIFS
jgi:hypothetical protein